MTPFLLPGAVIAEDNSEHGTLEISLQSHWPAHFGSGIRREFLAIPGRILLGDLGPESLQACRHSHPDKGRSQNPGSGVASLLPGVYRRSPARHAVTGIAGLDVKKVTQGRCRQKAMNRRNDFTDFPNQERERTDSAMAANTTDPRANSPLA